MENRCKKIVLTPEFHSLSSKVWVLSSEFWVLLSSEELNSEFLVQRNLALVLRGGQSVIYFSCFNLDY
jgi:hypothetical protein